MSSRISGRTLGLGAVLLSAFLLIVALVGGMTGDSAKSGTVLAHAASAKVELSATSGAGGPSVHDEHSADDQADHHGNR